MSTLIEVGNFYDPEEAYCAWGYLNANGVYAVIQNEYHLTSAPWLRVALGGYRLLAPVGTKPIVDALFAQISSESDTGELESDDFDHIEAEDKLKNQKFSWTWFPVALFTETPFVPKHRGGVIGALQYAFVAMFYISILGYLSWWFLT